MRVDEFMTLDATSIDALVASNKASPGEVAAAALERHRQVHASINAVVEWYDAPTPPLAVSEDRPALRGVPFLRKDYGSAEIGRLVEMGSRIAIGNRATETARYVADLQDAGAQIVGRSAVPEFIQHGVTESRLHGITRNPWDLAFSAGGSSGGAAAAVAAGVVPIAHASDCAGSIRIPASTCGLLGLKPGRQRVPWSSDWNGIAQEFVLCRTVRDANRCLDILGRGSYVPSKPTLKVAFNADHWAGQSADPFVVDATERMTSLLLTLGHRVESIAQPVHYPTLMNSWPTAFSRFAYDDAHRLAARTGRVIDETMLEPMTLAAIEQIESLTDQDRVAGDAARAAVVERLERELVGFDVLLTPTLGRVTIPLNKLGGEADPTEYFELNDAIFPYSFLFNLAGWPSVSVPAGTDEQGHPVGIQLSAVLGSERMLLDLAAAIEEAQPWPVVAPTATPTT